MDSGLVVIKDVRKSAGALGGKQGVLGAISILTLWISLIVVVS
jgi:hypothetical protein